MIKKIKESSLYVNDLEKTKSFYHGLLEFEIVQYLQGKHIFFKAGESILLCFLHGKDNGHSTLPPHEASGHIHLAFEVEANEYENWKKIIGDKKIPIEMEYDWGRGFKSFYFRDPDMHLLEIIPAGLWDKG